MSSSVKCNSFDPLCSNRYGGVWFIDFYSRLFRPPTINAIRINFRVVPGDKTPQSFLTSLPAVAIGTSRSAKDIGCQLSAGCGLMCPTAAADNL